VPIPTIKHYLREGLLPEPVRTSKNMAYYDTALVPRVKAIKRLQRKLLLPLKVIRQVLDRLDDGTVPAHVAVEATIARVLSEQAPREVASRRQLLEQGVDEREIEFFTRIGVLEPQYTGSGEVFRGEDVTLMQLLAQARRAGLSPTMLPPEVLHDYVSAVASLVRVELQMFRGGVIPEAGDDIGKLTEIATTLSERLVVALRRKLLLPILRELSSDLGDPAATDENPQRAAN
jgi:DNA-binding transcriptional MerR regulator